MSQRIKASGETLPISRELAADWKALEIKIRDHTNSIWVSQKRAREIRGQPFNDPPRPGKGSASSMIRRCFGLLAVLMVFATPAHAQKNCKKGIPCGNSCISATKTCRIGSTPAAPAYKPPPRKTGAAAGTAHVISAPAEEGRYVGSSRGNTYYKAGCAGAQKLSPANKFYFKTKEEAEARGYRPSRQAGC